MRIPARLTEPLLTGGVFLLDRTTKLWAFRCLQPRYAINVLPFFHLTYVENTGAAWGMFQGSNRFLIVVSLGMLALLLTLKRGWPGNNFWVRYGVALVVGGALGNLYDRIAFGYVVDFLDFRVWPVFNVADSCITVGAFCLAWALRSNASPKRP